MPEPKIVLRMRPPAEAARYLLDHGLERLHANAAVGALAVIVEDLLTESAGLREALEAARAECAKVIEERDRLRMQREQVWQAIDVWADDPDTNVDQLLDVWASHEKALAERDAMRPVVEALRVLVLLKDGPRDAAYEALKSGAWATARTALAAVDSYAQSSNPGEKS